MNEDILFYAFRYALGRKTYAVTQVVDYIIEYWPMLSDKFKNAVIKQIKTAIHTNNAGDGCDITTREKILALEGK